MYSKRIEAKAMAGRQKRGVAGDKTICLPMADNIDCTELVDVYLAGI